MRLNVSAWSIRKPDPRDRRLHRADDSRHRQLPRDVDHPVSEYRHPDRSGADHAVGRRAVRARVAGHQESRGRRRQPQRRLARHVDRSPTARRRPSSSSTSARSTSTARSTTSRTRSPRSAADLPRTIDEPIISRIDIEGLPIVTYAASAPGISVEQLSWFIDDNVARELQSIRGVGEVKRYGGVDREIRVSLDPEKLLALGVTAATVNEQVRADNVDLGGGRGEVSGQEQAIRTLAGARKRRRSRRAADRACRAGARSGSTNSEP